LGADLALASLEVMAKVIDNRAAALIADEPALVGRRSAYFLLDRIERSDAPQHLGGDRRSIGKLVELASYVRPAECKADVVAAPGKRSITAIAIDLQDAGKVLQVRFCAFALAILSIDIDDHRWIASAPRFIVACIGPDLAGLSPTASGIEHRCGGLVGKQSCRSPELLEDVLAHGTKIPGRADDASPAPGRWLERHRASRKRLRRFGEVRHRSMDRTCCRYRPTARPARDG